MTTTRRLRAPPEARPERPARRERLWTWMLVPGTLWMSMFFVSALLLLIALSFGTTDALGNPRFGTTLDNIVGIFEPTYLRVILRSLVYAVAASAICLLIAYPVAYAIARHGGRYKNALVALLVVPFFANYLVRMYGWQTLLSDEGVVMTWLRGLGVPASFHILDTSGAVIGGLVYGYVVFMILPIYASLERMDGSLIEAGRDLYGTSLRTFFCGDGARVEVRCVRRAGTGVPACDGRFHQRPAARRSRQPDDRQPHPGQVLRRPELAARCRADDGADGAAADLHVRLPAPDGARCEGGQPMKGSGMNRKPRFAIAVTVLLFVLLYLPIFAVVLFSFNNKKSLTVFEGWSLRWYEAFFNDAELTKSLETSLVVAAVAMVGSVVIGVLLAFGLVRARSRLGRAANVIMLIPLITPEIVTGVASLMLFKGVGLQPSLTTLMIAQTTFSISYVTVILRARVAELNPEVEQAAMDLGASRLQALRLVTLPAMIPAITSAAILIFTIVFDDFVLAFFTSGVDPQPLSVRIYSAIRFGIQPSINAVGTLMLVGSLVLIAIALLVPRFFGKRGNGLDLFGGTA